MTRIDFNGTQLRLHLSCGCLISEGYREHCLTACDFFGWSEQELTRAGWHCVWAALVEEGADVGDLSPLELAHHLEPFNELIINDVSFQQALVLTRTLLGQKRNLAA